MEGMEQPLDQFYSIGDPQRFQGEIGALARERLEAELLDNRIGAPEAERGSPARRRRSVLYIVLPSIFLILAAFGTILFLLGSAETSERLRLSATILHSTEGKLIEALAFKAENDRDYVEDLLAQYRMRIEERRLAAQAVLESPGPGSASDRPGFPADRSEAALAAERQVQELVEQRVSAAVERAATSFSSGDPDAASQKLEQLMTGIARSPRAAYVEAVAEAFRKAEAVAKRGREALAKAERMQAALAAREDAGADSASERRSQADLLALRAASAAEIERSRREGRAALSLVEDFVHRLSAYPAWDGEMATAEAARIPEAGPGVAELSRAIVAFGERLSRDRGAGSLLRFFGTVSMVLGERILADVAASGASVGSRVRIYRSGGQGAQGRELAQGTITEIRGNTATIRSTTPGTPAGLGIAPLDTIYFVD